MMFVKYPQKGEVKSRLSKVLDGDIVVDLYKYFVSDMLKTILSAVYDLKILFYPPDSAKMMIDWLGDKYRFSPQSGKDLGEKMNNAFITTFSEGYKYGIIIGSDSPDLPLSIIDEAFHSLESNDAVIGPAFDGGYYLIGFKKERFLPDIFNDINWSTDTVYSDTLSIFRKSGYNPHVLPRWSDIDTIDDLKLFINKNKGNKESRSLLYIKNIIREDLF